MGMSLTRLGSRYLLGSVWVPLILSIAGLVQSIYGRTAHTVFKIRLGLRYCFGISHESCQQVIDWNVLGLESRVQ